MTKGKDQERVYWWLKMMVALVVLVHWELQTVIASHQRRCSCFCISYGLLQVRGWSSRGTRRERKPKSSSFFSEINRLDPHRDPPQVVEDIYSNTSDCLQEVTHCQSQPSFDLPPHFLELAVVQDRTHIFRWILLDIRPSCRPSMLKPIQTRDHVTQSCPTKDITLPCTRCYKHCTYLTSSAPRMA